MDSLELFNTIGGNALMGFRIGTEYDRNEEQKRQNAFERDMALKQDARQEALTNDQLATNVQARVLAQSGERRAEGEYKDSLLTSQVNRESLQQGIAASKANVAAVQSQEARAKEEHQVRIAALRQQQQYLVEGRALKGLDALVETYKGDWNAAMKDPIGQQMVFNLMSLDPAMKQAVASHGKPAGLAQGTDGNFMFMVQGNDGQIRPITVDGKVGSLPFKVSPQAIEANMAAIAARLDINTQGQLRKSMELAMSPEAATTVVQAMDNVDPALAASAVPKAAPNLSAASRAATKADVAGATPAKPVQEIPQAKTSQGVPPLLAAPQQNPLAPQQNPLAPQQNPLAPQQNPLAPQQENVSAGTPAPAADVLAQSLPISPVSPQVNDAINGVSAVAQARQNGTEIPKTAADFWQMHTDFTASQQFAAENADARARAGTAPASVLAPVTDNWDGIRKKVGEAVLAASSPVSAAKFITGKDDTAEAIGTAVGTGVKAAGYAAGKAKTGAVYAWSAAKNGLTGLADSFAKGWAEGVGDTTKVKAPDTTTAAVAAKNLDTATNVVVTFGADLQKARSVAPPVSLREMKTQGGLAKTYEAVGSAISAEAPTQRMVNDISAVNTLATKGRSVDKAMAVARLVKSGALPSSAMANYLQSGVLSFDSIEAAAKELRARADLLQYQHLTTKYTVEQRGELQKQYKPNMDALVQPALADIANQNPMLLQKLTGGTGSGKFKTPATGVKPEALLYGVTDGFLRDPTTARLLVPGWNGEPPELLSPDQLRQAMQMVTAYMRHPNTGAGGKKPWLFSEGAPNGLIADSQSFTEFVVDQAHNTKGDR